MKIIYCMHSLYKPGGMERVLINKISWLSKSTDWELIIVTTDQKNRDPFYPLPTNVRIINFDINYSDDNGKNIFGKTYGYLRKKAKHKRLLSELLMQECADIIVSLYPCESSFIPSIKDGSKKVLELHFCKYFRIQYGRSGILGLIDKWRTKLDEKIVRKFDKFIVLTEEDCGYWDDIPNIEVIPNAVRDTNAQVSTCDKKRVIAVGRLDYQKGFDRLIDAWGIVQNNGKFNDWVLDIFGQGEWQSMLQAKIIEKGISSTVHLNSPSKTIDNEYSNSSMLVMSSHYEGFPMVMLEAMALGLPVVSFDFKCGPLDIIENGVNGMLVPEGDVTKLAEAMMTLMSDDELRKRMGKTALSIKERYSEEKVMAKWKSLFENLAGIK